MKLQTSTKNKIHLIGIGGIGMSGLARILMDMKDNRDMKYQVSGSDLKNNDITDRLAKQGVIIKVGHDPENIDKNVSIVVASTAISPVNPEILIAKERNIPILHRGEILAEIMRLKKGIAVAGTHGKTTTTGLIASIFQEGGLSPTVIIGGQWGANQTNAVSGKSQYLICESDESDASFLKLYPVYSVVTNIDLDHMDYYKNEENLISHFVEFINHIPFYGKNFICLEDSRLHKIKNQITRPYVGYGFDPSYAIHGYDLRYEGLKSYFQVNAYRKKLGRFELNLNGEHNVLNALAAIGIALEAKIPVKTIKASLKNFIGIRRRMTRLGKWKGLTLIDDYAHHPVEISATLSGVRHLHEKKIVAFQPHRYSRTLQLYKETAQALSSADLIFITEVYGAGEEPIKGVTGHLIYDEIRKINPKKKVFFFESIETLTSSLLTGIHYLSRENLHLPNQSSQSPKSIKPAKATKLNKGIFFFMGAGDINRVGMDLVK